MHEYVAVQRFSLSVETKEAELVTVTLEEIRELRTSGIDRQNHWE